MPEMAIVESKLREYARAQMLFGGTVLIGMFIIIVVLTYSLLQAHTAAEVRQGLVEDNCQNIQAIRTYFGDLDTALTKAIRGADPTDDLTLIRELVDQARIAKEAMVATNCPGG